MSGLSLAAHPPSGGRRAAPLRRKPRCLRARLVCACPACPPLWGFRLLCFMPGCCPTVLRSHFLACPRAVAWARKCLRVWGCTCCGRVCLRVAGVWCLRYCPCSCGCLRACLCALAWGCGAVWSRRPFAPACLLACLRAHALVWACWRVRGWRVRGGRVGGLVGAGQSCPAPYCVAWATSVAPWRGRERRGVWGAPGVLTRAHTQREEEGRERGATGRCRCWPGWGLWVVVAYHVGEQCPSEGEQN